MKEQEPSREWMKLNRHLIRYGSFDLEASLLVTLYTRRVEKHSKKTPFLDVLRSMKWTLISHFHNNRKFTIANSNCFSIKGKNAYVVNFKPEDKRHFSHINSLIRQDPDPVILTVEPDVFNFYSNEKLPVVLLENKGRLQHSICFQENTRKDLTLRILGLRAAALVDSIEAFCSCFSYPARLVTLQDFHTWDAVFAVFFKGKIPTVTLQHGLVTDDPLWETVLSDFIITWGENPAQKLQSHGIPAEKIKPLGTAKYDSYFTPNNGDKTQGRILVSIQPDIPTDLFDRFSLLWAEIGARLPGSKLVFRYHPGVSKEAREQMTQKISRAFSKDKAQFSVSDIRDPLEDIACSSVVLTNQTSLAVEAILLQRPVVEYTLENPLPFYGDYRDFVFNTGDPDQAAKVIMAILSSSLERNQAVRNQNAALGKEILPPPRAPEILKFIRSLPE
ncbi:hypothetical protein Taci_1622 [Thermanaerovibrio acidaminovorans DSM 6589]|uniref:Uncharacterized protein n=1 Tax=Thermanaerovibrio acidaminovorans (strain ATCC 49978 / DSM 6589 / Su883) TaxID=525903 RepID=D1B752_THEAS|nr:hypothetical protein Taci_1622 [Thermanaerovibrio acidaminovorans DSM 6589]